MSEEVKTEAAVVAPEVPAKSEAAPEKSAVVESPAVTPAPVKEETPPAPAKEAEGAKVSEGEKPKENEKVVPERYDLKLPEDSVLDAPALERIASLAKERGLSQEEAEAAVIDTNKRVAEVYDQQTKQWLDEVKADKEIGGEALNKNVELAKRVVDRFGSESLKKDLNRTGLGNHPELVRFLSKIGNQMSEDVLVHPGAQVGGAKSVEDLFYPTKTGE